jgi:hypothetical protein
VARAPRQIYPTFRPYHSPNLEVRRCPYFHSVWHIPAVPMRENSHGRHPTQKPLRVVDHG